jgi:Tfp pilus assembly protein PilZ
LGDHVVLTVRVWRPPREFIVHGQLAWARRKASKQLGESFGIDFLASDEGRRGRLLAFARNELTDDLTRLEPRVQVELPVRVLFGGRSRSEFLADLSPGGAFIRTWAPLEPNLRVELLVRPPRSLLGLQLFGRVAWQRNAGADPGMGIEFLNNDLIVRERIKRLLHKLSS